MRRANLHQRIAQSSQMKSLKFILVFVCFTTVSLENAAEFSHLQSDLLNLLEIKEKPSVSRSRSQVPKYVMDLYKEQAHTSGFTKGGKSAPGKTIRTFFRDTRISVNERHFFFFNLSTLQAKETIHKAELRIFKRRSKLENTNGYFKVTVNRLNRRAVNSGSSWKRKLTVVDTKLVKCRRVGGWIVLNVTSAVAFWSSWPSRNFGLWITVAGLGVPQSDFYIATGGRKEPILIIYGDNTEKSNHGSQRTVNEIPNETRDPYEQETRWKRKNDEHPFSFSARSRRSVHEERCARQKLFVKFRELKWDKWIIAPRGFSAYYCTGTCPEIIEKFYNPTNHAIIQNLLHHRYNKKIPAACCVPTSLHSMSMMYFERDGSIVLREYSGMVASACGCR